ncbi:Camphor 5-monooxygenase [Mycolicibacterium rhodesiae JS60]|nr:Camphor 5-monooxygenase [Mycolicibacterium rhodesiae JS60]
MFRNFDHLDPNYEQNPFPTLAKIREESPVARSDNYGGFWLTTKFEDVEQVAHNHDTFSSEIVMVPRDLLVGFDGGPFQAPPLTSDPPFHSKFRRMLLPLFTRPQIEKWEGATWAMAAELLDAIGDRTEIDAATEYAQNIPIGVIARMMGVDENDRDLFTSWVHRLFENPGDVDVAGGAMIEMYQYLYDQIERRREHRGSDLISILMETEVDGTPLDENELLGSMVILLLAGVDTTWSAIGCSLHHLATHPEDRQRLVAALDEPPGPDSLWFTATEELLRAFAPVTVARLVKEDTELRGNALTAGDLLMLSFGAANRDPDAFENPDEVIIDRKDNRHFAFGVGIHRCIGSTLARMELRVALQSFLRRHPDFAVTEGASVRYGGGQVRGPRSIPLTIAKN